MKQKENIIKIDSVVVKGCQLEVCYTVSGEWQKYFTKKRMFFCEYNENIEKVPKSIAVVPFLGNIIQMAWILDAKVILDELDNDFFYSIDEFKKGYVEMYPMFRFAGSIEVKHLVKNENTCRKTAMFFSGGVDATSTLITHYEEKPDLITVWGSDIDLNDNEGWGNVFSHLQKTSEKFQVGYKTIKSNFREIIDAGLLSKLVKKSNDGWWHGFQHSVGVQTLSSPLAFLCGYKTIYFASTFTLKDKGKITCASCPEIDNRVKFCGTNIFHDGYEYTRQQKVGRIVDFSKKTGKKPYLRVCWISRGGKNCCVCEKCQRTAMALVAEKENPNDYGFSINEKLIMQNLKHNFCISHILLGLWKDIQERFIETHKAMNNTGGGAFMWFQKINLNHINCNPLKMIRHSLVARVIRKAKKIIKKHLMIIFVVISATVYSKSCIAFLCAKRLSMIFTW